MKRFRYRRLWLIAGMLFILGLLLGACGGTGQSVETSDDTNEVQESSSEENQASSPNEETAEGLLNPDVSGEVEFWHFWGSPVRRTAIRRVVALCQAELPNITITEVFKPWGDIWTANVAAVAAGTGMPDVIVENRPQLPKQASDEIATNLQPYIDRDNFDPSVFAEFAWNETLYEGDSYGVPFETDVRVLFYNKIAFEEAGLDPEKPPQTWEEVVDYARKLDSQEGGEWKRIGFMPLWHAGPDFWAYTNGWEAVVDGTPNVNDPAYIESLTWIKEQVDHYGGWQALQNFRSQYSAAPNDLFMSGAAPMVVDVAGYSSILNFYRPKVKNAAGEEVRLEWGVAPIPYKVERANWSGGFALSIPKGAENPDAAWEFIKCATSQTGQSSWARDTAAIPTHKGAMTDPVLMADPNWQFFIEEMEYSRGSDYVTTYPNWPQEVHPRLEEVWGGALTPEQMAQEAQAAIDKVIEENQ